MEAPYGYCSEIAQSVADCLLQCDKRKVQQLCNCHDQMATDSQGTSLPNDGRFYSFAFGLYYWSLSSDWQLSSAPVFFFSLGREELPLCDVQGTLCVIRMNGNHVTEILILFFSCVTIAFLAICYVSFRKSVSGFE